MEVIGKFFIKKNQKSMTNSEGVTMCINSFPSFCSVLVVKFRISGLFWAVEWLRWLACEPSRFPSNVNFPGCYAAASKARDQELAFFKETKSILKEIHFKFCYLSEISPILI